MNNKEIFKKIEILENEVLELKNTFLKSTEPKPYELFLKIIEYNSLAIVFFDNEGDLQNLGVITEEGHCFFLNNNSRKKSYDEWAKKGFEIKKDNKVSWKDGVYEISKMGFLTYLSRKDIKCGEIYHFTDARVISGCEDENIRRYEYNKTPILY